MFKWLLLLTQALEIFSLVFMAWLSKEPSRFWKSGHHILLGGRRRLIVWLKTFALFFFNWYQTFIITRHCTSDLWHQTSTFWNKELNCWLQTLCQQLLERKDRMDCSSTWHLYQVNFFQFWHMSFGQSKLRPTCIDKWVTANTCLWKYPWIPKSH